MRWCAVVVAIPEPWGTDALQLADCGASGCAWRERGEIQSLGSVDRRSIQLSYGRRALSLVLARSAGLDARAAAVSHRDLRVLSFWVADHASVSDRVARFNED